MSETFPFTMTTTQSVHRILKVPNSFTNFTHLKVIIGFFVFVGSRQHFRYACRRTFLENVM